MHPKGLPGWRAIADEYRRSKRDEELRGNWVNVVVHRWPSFGVVWAAARLGITPTAISLIAAAVALSMPLAAWAMPLTGAAIAVCILGNLFQILDCADGALARLTGQGSERGGRLDFLIDMAQWGLLYGSIGLLAARALDDGAGWTALALAAAWLRLLARIMRDAIPWTSKPDPGPFRAEEIPLAFIAGLSGAIPFLALGGEWLWLSVWFLAAYSALDFADALIANLRFRA